MMRAQKKTLFLTILNFMRRQLQKDGLYIDNNVSVQFPRIVCTEWAIALAYYGVSLVLLWLGDASFWSLLLNSFCLARAITKTTRKSYCYTEKLRKFADQDFLNEQTRNFLKYNCKAYLHTQYREIICAAVILTTAFVLLGLKDGFGVVVLKVAASIALVGAAWDDFLCEAEDICSASPRFPSFAGN